MLIYIYIIIIIIIIVYLYFPRFQLYLLHHQSFPSSGEIWQAVH